MRLKFVFEFFPSVQQSIEVKMSHMNNMICLVIIFRLNFCKKILTQSGLLQKNFHSALKNKGKPIVKYIENFFDVGQKNHSKLAYINISKKQQSYIFCNFS